ncbi:MAG: TatD family hydrolase [Janthinobacterium lividum]
MFDTHCHIDQYPDPLAVAQLAEQRRLVTIGVTQLPSHFQEGRDYVKHLRYVRLALGLHPLLAAEHTARELALFRQLLPTTSYIGEIGLDFSRAGQATAARQEASFQHVLGLLGDRPRLVTLHSRGAEQRVLELLREYQVEPVIFHWYTGPTALLKPIQEAGHYFSINLAMLRTQSGCRIIENIALNRLLLETDGPYIQVSGRAIQPTDVEATVTALSAVRQLPVAIMREHLNENFKKLLQPIKDYSSK